MDFVLKTMIVDPEFELDDSVIATHLLELALNKRNGELVLSEKEYMKFLTSNMCGNVPAVLIAMVQSPNNVKNANKTIWCAIVSVLLYDFSSDEEQLMSLDILARKIDIFSALGLASIDEIDCNSSTRYYLLLLARFHLRMPFDLHEITSMLEHTKTDSDEAVPFVYALLLLLYPQMVPDKTECILKFLNATDVGYKSILSSIAFCKCAYWDVATVKTMFAKFIHLSVWEHETNPLIIYARDSALYTIFKSCDNDLEWMQLLSTTTSEKPKIILKLMRLCSVFQSVPPFPTDIVVL